ncbi:hypothetical protein HRbin06_00236 [archaeon HR06]|nr:hypothetical protein HRbin06_00236 [archaeon HR06]
MKINLFQLIPFLLPLIYVGILDSSSLLSVWNLGRGYQIISLIFLILEFLNYKDLLKLRKKYKNLIYFLIFLILLYFTYLYLFKGRDFLENLGKVLKVPLPLSFFWFFDNMIFTVYIFSCLIFSFENWRFFTVTLIYLLANTSILALDAFFPYDTLGPFQILVPFILYSNSLLLSLFGAKTEIFGNIMEIRGENFFRIRVFWPSAGIHSLIIYSFVMLGFLLRFPLKWKRKILYFTLGFLGTFFMNIVRIFLLSYYAAFIQADVKIWEEFHSILGEILFLSWLVIYLTILSFKLYIK